MATVIKLPEVAVSRQQADHLISDAHLANGDAVEINGRNLSLNTDSFATQLAYRLSEVPRITVTIRGGGSEWINDFERLARQYNVGLSAA